MKKQSYQRPVIRLIVLHECLLNPASPVQDERPSASFMSNPGFGDNDDDNEGFEE